MRVGYACVNTQLPSSARTVRLANATPERLREITAANLDALEAILRWNVEHDVFVFRLTSNLIPLASHPVNTVPWWDEFADRLREIGDVMTSSGMSISTHPGQYTLLTSERPEVVEASVAELEYHERLLSSFGLDSSHKIVIHVGAGAADRDRAFARFAQAFARLSPGVAARLAIENDERWSLDTVLALAERLGVVVVFDAFHHRLAPSFAGSSVRDLVLRAGETWDGADRQEVHFSTQEPGRRAGAHAATIDLEQFARFEAEVGDLPLDCVLEVKDKEQSVLRARRAAHSRFS